MEYMFMIFHLISSQLSLTLLPPFLNNSKYNLKFFTHEILFDYDKKGENIKKYFNTNHREKQDTLRRKKIRKHRNCVFQTLIIYSSDRNMSNT